MSPDISADCHRIFISYARDDDEEFAKDLWHDLESQGVRVWWDREAMESRGLPFLREIRDAISSVERLLLIVGPRARHKPYVEAEWRHALREGVVVTPLLRLGDYDDVPEALRPLHCEDVREVVPQARAFEKIRNIVATPVPRLGQLVGVPRLPTPYLERPGRLDALRSRVLIDAYEPIDLEPDQRITSITGMGGVGKSVLASALAQAPEVRRSFADGVFWISVGRDVDMLRTLTYIGIAIGDDAIQSYTGIVEARLLLGKALAKMNCLIILDDVWQVDVAEALHTAAGKSVRILLTGRKRNLFASAGVHEVPVDELTRGEALDLLAMWTNTRRDQLPVEASEIAGECGNLPLALAMIGATIRRQPDRWTYALVRLRRADISKIERKLPDYAYETLDRAMLVSFEELNEDQQRKYLDFVAVPEDAAAPADMMSTWWTHEGTDPLEVTKVLDDLVDRSLLRVDERQCYTLHDVQHDFLAMRISDKPALHERWLEAFTAETLGNWAAAADDGYLFDHLGYHLRGAGREDEWRSLLVSFPWLERKTAVRGFPAVLLDLAAYPADDIVGALYRVCRRSAHILTNDPAQLAAQLLSRLEVTPVLQPLIDGARDWRGGMWLRPVTRSLGEEGEPTLALFRGREIDGHAGTPRSIVLSPDDKLIASGGGSSNDLTIKIWSAAAAKLLHSYNDAVLAGGMAALAFVALDGQLAAAGPNDVSLYTLGVDLPMARHTFDDARITVICGGGPPGIAFIGFDDGRVLSWNSANGNVVEMRAADGRGVIALSCSAASPRLAIAVGKDVECRDINNASLIGRVGHELDGGGFHFQGPPLVITTDGSRVIFGNPLSFWAVDGGDVTLMENLGAPTVVGLSQDGAVALTAPNSKELIAIETTSGRPIGRVRNSREFSCLALTRDGRAVATGDFEHDIKLWDLTHEAMQLPDWEQRGSVRFLAVCDDERLAITISEAEQELWDIRAGKPVQQQKNVVLDRVVRRSQPLLCSRIERDLRARLEKAIGVKTDDFSLYLESPLGVLAFSLAAYRAVSATRVLAKYPDMEEESYTGGDDGFALELWDLEDLRQPLLLRGHMSPITCADMTSDGKYALTGSTGRLLRLWDLDAGACLQVLRGHRGIVFDCAITDDARFAISGSEDMTTRLWDLKQGKLLFTFAASSAVTACDIARSGSMAMAAEISGRVHTFTVEGLTAACN
jgi:WD40 repeat protein